MGVQTLYMAVVMVSGIQHDGVDLWVGGCSCHIMADSGIVWVGILRI